MPGVKISQMVHKTSIVGIVQEPPQPQHQQGRLQRPHQHQQVQAVGVGRPIVLDGDVFLVVRSVTEAGLRIIPQVAQVEVVVAVKG